MRLWLNATAPVNCEPFPPKNDQNTELLPPKYEQGLLEEKQCCEKDLYENKQHGIQYHIHGIQNGDQEEFASLEFELERKGPTRPPNEHSTDARSVLTADSNHMSSPRPLQPLTCSDKSQNYILQSGNSPVPLRPP